MVAERSRVCRPSGTARRISSTAGRNPMSSIWSASSSTTTLTLSRRMAWRAIRSIRRPGVATTTWQPWPSSLCWRTIDSPPTTATAKARRPKDRRSNSRPIWVTSSRVGARIRACGRRSRSSIFSRIGSRKAAVLPVPVGALPRQSRPARAAGTSPAWIGLGLLNPARSRLRRVISLRPRPAKVNVSGSSFGLSIGNISSVVVCKLGSLMTPTCGADGTTRRVRSSVARTRLP